MPGNFSPLTDFLAVLTDFIKRVSQGYPAQKSQDDLDALEFFSYFDYH